MRLLNIHFVPMLVCCRNPSCLRVTRYCVVLACGGLFWATVESLIEILDCPVVSLKGIRNENLCNDFHIGLRL